METNVGDAASLALLLYNDLGLAIQRGCLLLNQQACDLHLQPGCTVHEHLEYHTNFWKSVEVTIEVKAGTIEVLENMTWPDSSQ